jgi:Rrf2 family protein
MKLSTRARYGMRALVALAAHYGKKPVLLKNIARSEDISVRYLENIMTLLVAGGMVSSVRGKLGGFRLARDPAQIKALDLVRMLEGSLAVVECVDNPRVCRRRSTCGMCDLWSDMSRAITEVLGKTTLAELAEKQKIKSAQPGRQMYYI